MIWVNLGNVSYQVTSITTSKNKESGIYQLYAERVNGTAIRLKEGSKEEIAELKEAFDYAIMSGFSMFDMRE